MITRSTYFRRLPTAIVMIAVSCLLAVILAFPGLISAKSTTPEQARAVVETWLALDATPLETYLSRQIEKVESYYYENMPAYYIVYLSPKGLVIVSADDMVEPIIGFLPEAEEYNPSHDNPLGALVSRDLPGRVLVAREVDRQVQSKRRQLTSSEPYAIAQRKWALLSATVPRAKAGEEVRKEETAPDEIYVTPMVQSKWDQSVTWGNGQACYNWYTPGCNPGDPNCPEPFIPGDPNNYPCGCVGTAMAQFMRYWQYPTGGVGTGSYNIYIDDPNTPVPYSLRGGDGSGGSYNWGNMPLDPNAATTDPQRQAIGALSMDVGASLNTWYTATGSAADTCQISNALVNTFGYGNAVNTWWFQAEPMSPPVPIQIPESTRNNMINPNLDAGYPTIVGIRSDGGVGHAAICDGYGYDQGTSYHHLNMGWSGQCDAWYNLPDVDPNSPPIPEFTFLNKIIYNVYSDPNSSGEIFSGRVTDKSNNPVGGVTITATGGTDGPLVAITNERGIYAFPMVDPNTTYNVRASKMGYAFRPNPWTVTTGTSTSTNFWDDFGDTGNVWLGSSVVGSKNIPIPAINYLLLTE